METTQESSSLHETSGKLTTCSAPEKLNTTTLNSQQKPKAKQVPSSEPGAPTKSKNEGLQKSEKRRTESSNKEKPSSKENSAIASDSKKKSSRASKEVKIEQEKQKTSTARSSPMPSYEPVDLMSSVKPEKPQEIAADSPKSPKPAEAKKRKKSSLSQQLMKCLTNTFPTICCCLRFLIHKPMCIVLWDYEAEKPDEITLKQGNEVQVLEQSNSKKQRWQWCKVRHDVTEKEGKIPRSYLAMKDTYNTSSIFRGTWFVGNEMTTFEAMVKLTEENYNPGLFLVCEADAECPNKYHQGWTEYQLVLRIRKHASDALTETDLGRARATHTKGKDHADDMIFESSEGEDQVVQTYRIHRGTSGRYFVNPGELTPNLYSLLLRLKQRPGQVPIRPKRAPKLQPGEVRPPVPAPPAHHKIFATLTPITALTPEEKAELLRPFGLARDDLEQTTLLGEGNFGKVFKGQTKAWQLKKRNTSCTIE